MKELESLDFKGKDYILYQGDCIEVMKSFPDGSIDCVVTDPPYGMKWNSKVKPGINGHGGNYYKNYGKSILNDDKHFDPTPFIYYPEVILFGMNHYPQYLKKGTCLVWLKRYASAFGSFLSDAEIAWFNKGHGVYCFTDLSKYSSLTTNFHPTQKPLELMKWCISFLKGNIIFDPFMGSGTTGVAAMQLGRKFIGIELDPGYFQIAKQRIENECNNLFQFENNDEKQTSVQTTFI